jgi:ankyrin repeat protein
MTDVSKFVVAAAAGDLAKVRELLAAAPSLLNTKDDEGATALHHAALGGRQEVVRYLVAQGADVNARDDRFDATPTGWAIEYLRELGGCLATEIEDALLSIRQRDVERLGRLLMRTPALAGCADAQGKALLQHAAETGDTDIHRLFEEATASLNKGLT